MKICNTLVLVGLVFNMGTASAGVSSANKTPLVPDIHQIPNVDAKRAPFDNACANFAAAVDANMTDAIVGEWKKQCSQHPDIGMCQETVKYVKEAKNGDNAGLVCSGRSASSDAVNGMKFASR